MTEKREKEIHQLRIKQLHKISNSKKGVVHVIYNFKTNILFKQTNYHGKRVQQFLRDNLTNALFCVFIYFQLVLVINEAVHSITNGFLLSLSRRFQRCRFVQHDLWMEATVFFRVRIEKAAVLSACSHFCGRVKKTAL